MSSVFCRCQAGICFRFLICELTGFKTSELGNRVGGCVSVSILGFGLGLFQTGAQGHIRRVHFFLVGLLLEVEILSGCGAMNQTAKPEVVQTLVQGFIQASTSSRKP